MKSRLNLANPFVAMLISLAVLGSTVACIFPVHDGGRGGEGDRGHEHDHEHEHEHEQEMHHPD
jgi:hypothetical protein